MVLYGHGDGTIMVNLEIMQLEPAKWPTVQYKQLLVARTGNNLPRLVIGWLQLKPMVHCGHGEEMIADN
jgi:hypothetical protein